jgi:flagellar biosynthesis protein FlhF
MQIKRYEANSIQDALTRIRADMGEDAVILSTKRLSGGRQPLFEIAAARDDRDNVASPGRGTSGKVERKGDQPEGVERLAGRIEELTVLVREVREGAAVRRELTDLKNTVNTLFDLLDLRDREKENHSGVFYHLISNGISSERARRLMSLVRKGAPVGRGEEAEQLDAVEELIRTSMKPLPREVRGKRTLAFVGPTGVGKTTTIAKLAARYALAEKRSVGLITTDTYRIAAVEQLKVYGKIMGLPVEVAGDGAAFRNALKKFSDRETILIDTPGRSRKDGNHLLKLKGIIRDAPVETHLLLSPTASREHMLDAAERFGIMDYGSIIFTKIDECTRFGPIYDVVDQVGKPVSYLTNGQNVPQDIEVAEPDKIARLIVRNRLN